MENKKLKNLKNWCKRHIEHQKGMDNDSGSYETMDYLKAWKVIDKINALMREGNDTKQISDPVLNTCDVGNSLSGFRKWQKENWNEVYLMSDEFMIKTYLATL